MHVLGKPYNLARLDLCTKGNLESSKVFRKISRHKVSHFPLHWKSKPDRISPKVSWYQIYIPTLANRICDLLSTCKMCFFSGDDLLWRYDYVAEALFVVFRVSSALNPWVSDHWIEVYSAKFLKSSRLTKSTGDPYSQKLNKWISTTVLILVVYENPPHGGFGHSSSWSGACYKNILCLPLKPT